VGDDCTNKEQRESSRRSNPNQGHTSHWGSAYEKDREAEEIYPAKGYFSAPIRQSGNPHSIISKGHGLT
jgi:hypothetical protein